MQKWFFSLLLLVSLPGYPSIIKKAPPKQVESTWSELTCTEQDRDTIYEIVSTVAEKSKLNLLVYQSYLREKGAQITHVHPLRFLGVIFSNPYLKLCMSYIWDDYFKRNNFASDLTLALNREADRGKLHPYLNDFAREVNLPAHEIGEYFNQRDWNTFFLYLLQP